MKTHLFKLVCLTDLHVGSGEANYSIIDNEVQKDTVLSDVPIIHGSGVKGAIREHFERIWVKNDPRIKKIFGGRDINGGILVGTGKEDAGKNDMDNYKFMPALCIARPLRVTNGDKPYILTTAIDILKSFSALLEGLGLSAYYKYMDISLNKTFACSKEGIEIEGAPTDYINTAVDAEVIEKLKILIDDDFAVARSLRDYDLPTRARNSLDDKGQSTNLWYEELVPHKSVFYFIIISEGSDEAADNLYKEFKASIESTHLQFGGNASVGYGYTTIKEVFSA